jgi:lysophospholipase L1-like esterase
MAPLTNKRLLAVLAGVCLAVTSRAASRGPVKIVVLGASTAAGKNLDWDPGCPGGVGGSSPAACNNPGWVAANSWVGKFAAYLSTARPGSTVVNLAVPGYATCKGLPDNDASGSCAPDTARNVTAAVALSPDAIIVSYPGNDVMNGVGTMPQRVNECMANLQKINAVADAAGIPVWAATSQPRNDITTTSAQFAAFVDQRDRTIQDFGARALDFWTPLAAPSGALNASLSLLLNNHPSDNMHPNAQGHQLLYQQVLAADILGAVTPPSAPGTPSLTVLSDTQIKLDWTDAADETGYRVEQSVDNVAFSTAAAGLAAGTTTRTVGGLSASTLYYFRVVAVNGAGEAASASAGAATQAPPADTLAPARPVHSRVR